MESSTIYSIAKWGPRNKEEKINKRSSYLICKFLYFLFNEKELKDEEFFRFIIRIVRKGYGSSNQLWNWKKSF